MVKKRSCLLLGRTQQTACKTATTLFACTLHDNFVHAAQSGIDKLVSVLGACPGDSLYIPLIHHFFTSSSPSLRGWSWKWNKELLLAVFIWRGMHPYFTLHHRLALGKTGTQHTSTKQAEKSSFWGTQLGLLKTRTQELNTFLLFPWGDSQRKALLRKALWVRAGLLCRVGVCVHMEHPCVALSAAHSCPPSDFLGYFLSKTPALPSKLYFTEHALFPGKPSLDTCLVA